MALNSDNSRSEFGLIPLLRLPFRPLFLAGSLFSVAAIGWWAWFWLNPFAWTPYGGPLWWHGHEMLFGFGAAIVVGFLLTAVQNWTGVPAIKGKTLAALVLIWLAARYLLAAGTALPGVIIAVVDVFYLLFATLAMAYPIIRVKQWRNLMFVPILLALALLNAASHWGVISEQAWLATQSLHATIMLFVLLIAVLGGRVIPAFTANTTGCNKASPLKCLEIASIISIVLMLIVAFYGFSRLHPALLLIFSGIAALTNGRRFLRWGFQNSGSEPLLWSLHLAYAFIPLGFFLLALQALGVINNTSAALHAFTVGSMGGLILAMISRVTPGHTGRPLDPHKLVSLAFVCILAAAVIRVVMSAWLPEFARWGIGIAAVLWVLAYSIYLYFYALMLVTASVDGGSG